MLTVLSPFTPMLFMGEEWAASTPWQFFTSHPESDLGRATAEGRIAEFAAMGWDRSTVPDPQDPETFRRSKLRWDERTDGMHARILRLHRDLIELRRTVPDLTDPGFGAVRAEADEETRAFRLQRGETEILVNFGHDPVTLPVGRDATVLLATHGESTIDGENAILTARSALVLGR